MFGLGWGELIVVGIVALIVVGPKDLPMMFRQLGKFTAQARQMAQQFSRAMDAAADEAGVKDVQKDLRNMTNPKAMGMDAVKNAVGDWDKFDDSDLDPERKATAEKIREATAKREAEIAEAPAEVAEAAEAPEIDAPAADDSKSA